MRPGSAEQAIRALQNVPTEQNLAAEQQISMKPVVLTLYTRHNCSLCEDMLFTLNDFSGDLNFSLSLIDIDLDSSLRERFNDLVPVLNLGDEEICHHFFDREALMQSLAAERAQH